jgi:hypothetical protein
MHSFEQYRVSLDSPHAWKSFEQCWQTLAFLATRSSYPHFGEQYFLPVGVLRHES